MIGLLLWGFVVVWFLAARWLAIKATRRLPPGKLRIAAIWFLTFMCVTLPLADEIIGGFQFRALCEKNAVLKVDAEKIRGKTIRLVINPSNKDVEGSLIRIYYSRLSYRNVENEEELASYSRYVAKGGLLVRTLAMTDGITPLTIHPSSCSAGLPDKYEFTLMR